MEDKRHGKPVRANNRTNEEVIDAPIRVRMRLAFDLDLRDFGGGIVEDVLPPARIIDRVVTVLRHGPQALENPPANPQPNGVFGRLARPEESSGDRKTTDEETR